MYIAYLLANIPWCAKDTYYYADSDAKAIPEDHQPGEEDKVREWGGDEVA